MLHPLDLVNEKLDVRGDVTEFGTCPELLEVVVKRMRSYSLALSGTAAARYLGPIATTAAALWPSCSDICRHPSRRRATQASITRASFWSPPD